MSLWVPPGTKTSEPKILGNQKGLRGKWLQGFEIVFTNPRNNRTQKVYIPASEDASQDMMEQAIGEAYDNFISDTDGLAPLAVHTPERRKAIGAAIREYRAFKRKMRESTNGKVFY